MNKRKAADAAKAKGQYWLPRAKLECIPLHAKLRGTSTSQLVEAILDRAGVTKPPTPDQVQAWADKAEDREEKRLERVRLRQEAKAQQQA
jgi:hypothetical protein